MKEELESTINELNVTISGLEEIRQELFSLMHKENDLDPINNTITAAMKKIAVEEERIRFAKERLENLGVKSILLAR